ncbi:lipid A biosynthesis lauroyl acyltransferase [Paraburkholderia sp. B3]|uniref:lipid A biosynthesis lauroyl acyltransferase n=1 Tax=Paraburkholderia sp. B3 TaxID=3134791 RepID=UPI00398293BA
MKTLGYWMLIGLLGLLSVLPYRWVASVGAALGAALYRLPSHRKHVVLVNLRLCFPTKTECERDELALAHFRHVARSYLERGFQWFGSARTIDRLVQIESGIDLGDPDPPPTIFMGFHFVGIEVGCMRYSMRLPVTALYTRMSNTRLCELARRQRGRFGAEMIERSTGARLALRSLRSGVPVMLAADMDHGITGSVFAPLFGVPACTLTSVSRLAKLTGARVVPFVTEVLPEYRGYKLTIFKPLANYPTNDELVDACTMNEFLEQQINRIPDQYYWVHRRFKNRPEGVPGVY